MTVAEFVAELSKFPPDALVVYRKYSDYEALEPGDAVLVRADDPAERIIRHHGHVMGCAQAWLKPVDPEPEYLTAVVLPGN